MAVKKTVVSGIYQSAEQAKRAEPDFLAAGLPKEAILISAPDKATSGGVLLSVHCDTSEQVTQAKEVLKKTGARDVSSNEETHEVFVES
jgi:hypothetical protein